MSKILSGKLIPALVLFSLCSASSLAHASISIGDYLKFRDDPANKRALELYLDAYMQALTVANGNLSYRGQSLLYCQPPHIALGAGSAMDLLDGAIRAKRATREVDAGISLLHELQMAYPCKP